MEKRKIDEEEENGSEEELMKVERWGNEVVGETGEVGLLDKT